mmetsp:Transcript_35055/g.99373  ORF Transcript_35055/g.99373 Transcript_35055/m.99373 type:complete len:312 (-) Transcript_35055:218-1153(-)|eukprot:CAMPEP_0117672684 /NCGR_PEP_ID=MMETSP0804-20121206/14046_1 /TAXON_ID=1074897 /ORGANISM="Tetraselmis astigmatica, Strain CCMP880" /LENGTH=311 /DNA_ID=CAMNT_0005481323 /DNA_START=48 /DNA_END=983 /DNA_ORIENTATION=+
MSAGALKLRLCGCRTQPSSHRTRRAHHRRPPGIARSAPEANSSRPASSSGLLECISRRNVLEAAAVSLLIGPPSAKSTADELAEEPEGRPKNQQAFFDFTIDGKPGGRVVLEIFNDCPVSDQRFADLSKGKMGVGYRRSKVDAINEDFIRFDGVSNLAYSSSEESPIAGGENIFKLEKEMSESTRKHDQSGLVSLVIKDPLARPPKDKLVAMGGKLVTIQEEVGSKPNGTAFVITTGPCPQLDSTNLVVGRVVEGMDAVARIAKLPSIPDNSNSPFILAAKTIGDKRADVAMKGYNKPYSKIVISRSGLLS